MLRALELDLGAMGCLRLLCVDKAVVLSVSLILLSYTSALNGKRKRVSTGAGRVSACKPELASSASPLGTEI